MAFTLNSPINITPTPVLKGKTPYECLFGVSPSYDSIRVFGCLCYDVNHSRIKDKFDSRSRRWLFLGYPFGKEGWRLYDLEMCEFFVSRDVIFFEDQFPYPTVLLDVAQKQWDLYFSQPSL